MQLQEPTREDSLSELIESKTSTIPSSYYLWTGLGLLGASLFLRVIKKKEAGQYISRLAAPLLIMGACNKLIEYLDHRESSDPQESPED